MVDRGRSRKTVLLSVLALLATLLLPAPGALAGRLGAGGGTYGPGAAIGPSPWPSMRHDLSNTGRSTIPALYHGGRPWAFRTGRGLFITPVIGGDGAVYFGSADNNFYALNPDGRLRWKFPTGNIIDAAAALDPSQRTVTIGSADENLYHLSTDPASMPPSKRVVWRYHATLKPATGQLVDWWEDDIAFGPDGNIYTGNTGGFIYSFTPSGRLRWTFAAGNSVWTMPAFGPGGTTYWGSVDRNIYALNSAGRQRWSTPTLGFVISSPAIGSDGTIYIGSFDSKLYALDPSTGLPKWTFGTNDHIYSSPPLGTDAHGHTTAIYIASTDGSIYKLSPAGKLLWSYDTGEAIRSSPVLGPGAPGERRDVLYVGSSDGSLYALDSDTGRRRWSYDTVSHDPILHDRHELNSSPALGRRGVYIGSEDGYLTYVPYDYCLHRADVRCTTAPGQPYPANTSRVFPVTAGGATGRAGHEGPVPSSAEITGRLVVRQGGQTVYAAMLPLPSTSSLIQTSPSFPFSAQLSGDGRYVFITPETFLRPRTTYRVHVGGAWGANGTRTANWTLPGTWTKYGSFGDSFTFTTAPTRGGFPMRIAPGKVSAFELRRLAVPLPAFLPSVNQIGFDSYVLLVGAIAIGRSRHGDNGNVLLWATQARRARNGTYLADPKGTLTFPLAGAYRADTLNLAVHGAVLTFSFGKVPLQRLDARFQMDRAMNSRPGASIYAEAVCATVPNYGPAILITGLCNAQGILAAAGTFITNAYPTGPANRRPRGLSVRSLTLRRPSAASSGSLTAELALGRGARYPSADHRIGLLLVDGSGQPLGLDYTAQSTSTDRSGNIRSVTLAIPARTTVPSSVRGYVIADVYPLYSAAL